MALLLLRKQQEAMRFFWSGEEKTNGDDGMMEEASPFADAGLFYDNLNKEIGDLRSKVDQQLRDMVDSSQRDITVLETKLQDIRSTTGSAPTRTNEEGGLLRKAYGSFPKSPVCTSADSNVTEPIGNLSRLQTQVDNRSDILSPSEEARLIGVVKFGAVPEGREDAETDESKTSEVNDDRILQTRIVPEHHRAEPNSFALKKPTSVWMRAPSRDGLVTIETQEPREKVHQGMESATDAIVKARKSKSSPSRGEFFADQDGDADNEGSARRILHKALGLPGAYKACPSSREENGKHKALFDMLSEVDSTGSGLRSPVTSELHALENLEHVDGVEESSDTGILEKQEDRIEVQRDLAFSNSFPTAFLDATTDQTKSEDLSDGILLEGPPSRDPPIEKKKVRGNPFYAKLSQSYEDTNDPIERTRTNTSEDIPIVQYKPVPESTKHELDADVSQTPKTSLLSRITKAWGGDVSKTASTPKQAVAQQRRTSSSHDPRTLAQVRAALDALGHDSPDDSRNMMDINNSIDNSTNMIEINDSRDDFKNLTEITESLEDSKGMVEINDSLDDDYNTEVSSALVEWNAPKTPPAVQPVKFDRSRPRQRQPSPERLMRTRTITVDAPQVSERRRFFRPSPERKTRSDKKEKSKKKKLSVEAEKPSEFSTAIVPHIGSDIVASPKAAYTSTELVPVPKQKSHNGEMVVVKQVEDKLIKDPYGDQGRYSGIMVQEMPHGKGTMHYSDGRTYSGAWKHGRWHGQGRAIFVNGDMYVGQYERDRRHGSGRYEWADGRIYDGDFIRNQRHGHGNYSWPDGANYLGDFVDGQRHGEGTYAFADGSVYQGEWQNGKYDGVGECVWATGRKYHGEWRAGQAQGYGVESRADGTIRHQGEWKKDRPVRHRQDP
jgi:hypothetical protein